MRITDVKATTVRIPLETNFGGSVYQVGYRVTTIVNIHTDEGIVSATYSGDDRWTYQQMHEYVVGPLRDVVMGEDPLAVERIWEKMFNLTPNMENKRAAMRAIAAVDIGIWDVIGRALRQPVRVLLGAHRDKTPVIRFAYYVEGQDNEAMVDTLAEQKLLGIAGVKLKVGGVSVPEDIERVRAIRHTLGDDFLIVCDANQAWTVDEALKFAGGVKEYNLAWLEEPVRWHNATEAMAQVRRHTNIPVAAGQGENHRWGCWGLVEGGAVDILNVDAAIAGGVTEWRRIAQAASVKGIRMAHHEEPHLSVHLLTSIPHGLYVEVFEPERDPVYWRLNNQLPEIADGFVHAPTAPGFGLDLNQELIEQYKVL